MKRARYYAAARRELDEAIEHDEADLPDRGLRLEYEVGRVVLRLRRFPLSAPIWPGLDAHGVRRAKVRRHPYLVVYMVHPDELIILAVAHTSKRPGYWASRVDDASSATPRPTKRKPARSRSQKKEREGQFSSPRSAQDFLPVFSPSPFVLDENTMSSMFTGLPRAKRC